MGFSLKGIARWYRRQPRWLQKTLAGVDVALNWMTGGDFPETLSERWAEEKKDGKKTGEVMCEILDEADPGHCEKADSPKH